jgi:NADPH2:quinone reductase
VDEWEEPRAEGDDQVVAEVLAAGLNPVDISLASGKFYAGPPPVPYVVGREAVVRLPDGTRAYVDATAFPFGTFAERTLIPAGVAIPVSDELDDGLAVALGVAGLAAWLPLEWRAELKPGERVLVLGASGSVGLIAVQAAKLLGAGRVVAAARSEEGLERARESGADATVSLAEEGDADALASAFREAAEGDLDVVIDPVWGEPAVAAITALGRFGRHVQIGQSAAPEATITSAAIRGKPLAILGHTNFAVPFEVRRAAYERMARHATAGEIRVDVERIPLANVADAWERQQRSPNQKLVIVPG